MRLTMRKLTLKRPSTENLLGVCSFQTLWSWILKILSYYLFIIWFIFEIRTKLQAASQRPKTVILKLSVFFFSIGYFKNCIVYLILNSILKAPRCLQYPQNTQKTKQKSRNYWPVKFYGFAHIWVAKLIKALQMAICKHSRNSKN